MLIQILIFIISLTVLILASDRFIGATEKIGLSLGISPFIIGVTIVAFGTSLPELATSIASVYEGNSEIVIGNVIGSNVTNILLVVGVTAIVGKGIHLDFNVMDVDMPLLIASAFLLYFALGDFSLSIVETVIFLAALVFFLINSIKGDKSDKFDRPSVGMKEYATVLIAGILIYFGAEKTIEAIVHISADAGISPELVSLTAVALGTSLPELSVSVAASRKGKHAIAVGNVLGSNIFNTYAVMGIPSLLGNLHIPSEGAINFSLPFMLAVTLLFALMCFSKRISKAEGIVLVLLYIFFLSELFNRGINL